MPLFGQLSGCVGGQRGARFTLRTDHKSLVWLHRFKDTEGMMARWLHALQQFQFFMLCNNFNFLSSTGQGGIMVMQTVSLVLHRHRVDSAPAPTAHRSSCPMTSQINHLTLPQPVARKTLIWYQSIRGRSG